MFATEKTDPAKRDANAKDLGAFVKTVLGLEPGSGGSWIAGPAFVPGSDLIRGTIPLWVAYLG